MDFFIYSRNQISVMLKVDWYLEHPLDFEYKNYILLDYIQSIDNSFKLHQLSPYLLWTEKLVTELKDFSQKKYDFYKSFERKKLVVENGQLKMTTITLRETPDIKEIFEIVDYSTPLLESKIKLGYKLLDKYPQILYF
jgi:hypothetical protein